MTYREKRHLCRALSLFFGLYALTARADFTTTQYTSVTYPGYGGGPGSYYCPPPGDPNYAPQPVNLYVPNLPSGGTVPLLIYFPGTGNDLWLSQLTTGHTDSVVKRAAELGLAAAAVSYRSLDFNLLFPDRMDAKERCVWNTSTASIASQLCQNQGPLATSGTQVDCAKGIVVAGHSQGGMMALMAKNYDSRVRAAHSIGSFAYYDPSAACMNTLFCNWQTALFPHLADPNVVLTQKGSFDSFVMGSSNRRVLSSADIRAEAGDIDPYFHLAYASGSTTIDEVAVRLNNLTNLSCSGSSPGACSNGTSDGNGWFIVGGSQLTPCAANTACTAVPPASHAGHCFFSYGSSLGCTNNSGLTEAWDPDPNYFGVGLTAGWSLDANLDWLLSRVSGTGSSASDAGDSSDAGPSMDGGNLADGGSSAGVGCSSAPGLPGPLAFELAMLAAGLGVTRARLARRSTRARCAITSPSRGAIER